MGSTNEEQTKRKKNVPTPAEHRRHKRFYSVVRPSIRLFLTLKYGLRLEKLPKQKRPFILMANHTTEVDTVMSASAVPKNFLYFIAGEHLFRGKHGKTLKKYCDPIPLPKGSSAIPTIRAMVDRVKAGYNIMIFPEGRRSFNGETALVSQATGKMVKIAGCDLITYRLQGGYFVAPRWAYKFRKGKMWGELGGVYKAEDLKDMDPQEIADIFNRDLHVNAYETQRKAMHKYRSDALAEGLENYLVLCPKCGKFDTMQSKGNEFWCTECGQRGIYDEYGFLRGDGLKFDSVYDWGKWIEKEFDARMSCKTDNEELLFLEKDVKLSELEDGVETQICTGDLKVYKDHMEMGGNVFEFEHTTSMSMLYFGKTLLFTCHHKYYSITGEHFHAWKEDRLYKLFEEAAKNKE
ncbi:MAG: 1-acyl-sn-glycerol-3-phosphate acyltransferase [Spirochaetales bacterium]|nr:1-acyl-sn-glycerol-3-phosphate acyltransferase [Spirochaetales bacterium]